MSGEHDAYVKDSVSTHAFLWPFTFKGDAFKEVPSAWVPEDALRTESGDRFLDAYMVAQYFNAQAREIFTGSMADGKTKKPSARADAPLCRRFVYKTAIVRSMRYLIGRSGGVSYELPIFQIKLFLFESCGVGVLAIKTYNTAYNDRNDIKRINDLGRRIRLPFLPNGEEGFILCAEQLGIVCGEDTQWLTDFRQLAKASIKEIETRNGYDEKLFAPVRFIYGLLFGAIGTKNELPAKIEEIVSPASDDRMFLVSMVKDKDLSDWGKQWNDLEPEASGELYSVAFADPGSPSCVDEKMQKKILEQVVNPRWSQEGTLYVSTNLSLMCLTSQTLEESVVNSVYRAFLIEYTDMAILVLAQRVSIESFAKEASEIVWGVEKKGRIENDQSEEIIELHERYVTWQNQINLFEVTDQEQGVEMYALMRKQMGVDGRIKHLAEQLEDMYAIANVDQNTKTNEIVMNFAIISIAVALLTFLATFGLELTESGKHLLQETNFCEPVACILQVVARILQGLSIMFGVLALVYAYFKCPEEWRSVLLLKKR